MEICDLPDFDNFNRLPTSYELKDHLKKYGKLFKNEADKWDWEIQKEYVPTVIKLIKFRAMENKTKAEEAWKKACENLKVDYVKRSDPLYDDVKAEFLKIVKASSAEPTQTFLKFEK